VRHLIRLLCLITSLNLFGCGDPIADRLNKSFPPVDIKQQRQAAIDTTAKALSTLPTPNIALGLRLADAQAAISAQQLRDQGVTELKLSGSDQLIQVHITFDRQFSERDAGDDPQLRQLLTTLKPRIQGTVDAYTGVAGAFSSGEAPVLELRLLPGIAQLEVVKVAVSGKYSLDSVGALLGLVLSRYRENLTGELARAPFTRTTIPVVAKEPIDISRNFSVSSSGTALSVKVVANPVQIPLRLGGIAWLVDHDHVFALIQLSLPTPPAAAVPPVQVANTFDAIAGQITGLLETSFGIAKPEGSTWVAVRKELTALTLTNAFSQANACLQASVTMPHQKVSAKIPMPSGSDISCSSDRDCNSSRHCAFEAHDPDTRNCHACLLRAPRVCAPRVCAFGGCVGGGCSGGQCVTEGNDPICETSKATQNGAYILAANARKADCDRLKATETAACQAEELGKKALCEAGKTTLAVLSKTGNFANVDVDADLSSDHLQACLRDVAVAPGLNHVAMNLDVTGQAKADVDVHFTPLDIVGHLACQFPWHEKRRFDAELRNSRVGLNSDMQFVTDASGARLKFAIDKVTLKGRLSPGPTEFLLKSPNMTVSCAGLNLVKPLLVTLTPFIPELRGDIDYDLARQVANVKLAVPALTIGNMSAKMSVGTTEKAIVVTASTPR